MDSISKLEVQVGELSVIKDRVYVEYLRCCEELRKAEQILAAKRNRGCAILQLPDEILVDIFMWGCRSGIDTRDSIPTMTGDLDRGVRFAMLVSHVSQRFRTVVIDIAYLWSKIQVIRPIDPLASIFFGRSKSLELELTVVPSFFAPTCYSNDFSWGNNTFVTNEWLNHMDRVRELTLFCDGDDVEAVTQLQDVHAPRLQVLSLPQLRLDLGWSQTPVPFHPQGTILRGGAPNLLNVTMLPGVFAKCRPALNSITTLDLCQADDAAASELTYREVVEFVDSLTSLNTLVLHERSFVAPNDPTADIPFQLEEVFSLTIHQYRGFNNGNWDVMGLIPLIVAPKLKHLALLGFTAYDLDNVYHDFRKEPVIQSLEFSNIKFINSTKPFGLTRDDIMGSWKDLETFTATNDGLEFIMQCDQRAMSKPCPPLWPQLTRIIVRCYEDEQLRATIQSRIAIGLPLATVVFPYSPVEGVAWYLPRVGVEFAVEM